MIVLIKLNPREKKIIYVLTNKIIIYSYLYEDSEDDNVQGHSNEVFLEMEVVRQHVD